MRTPFALRVAAEHTGTEAKATLWAALRIDPAGHALEKERAPLAIALVIDTSSSMGGPPIGHALQSCEIVADLLDARDALAIVTFSTHAGVRCGLTRADDAGKAQIKASLVGVAAVGNTNMHGGIEVAAGVLATAPSGLRRVMVVLSDGQPNIGLSTAAQLATYVKSLGVAVSTLGFGLHHDENVLQAIATAGSGRYAYIADPAVARVDMARAALAHGGVVAANIELEIRLHEGVEILRVLPGSQLRVGGTGVKTTIGDVFVDEGRLVALELQLDLPPSARGRLADFVVRGQAPDGSAHQATTTLAIDVRAGAPTVDAGAQRDVVTVQADAARAEARAQADRRAYPQAAAVLRQMIARIDANPGFVADDGSVLAELREQLVDEATSYETTASDAERVHMRKANLAYNYATPTATPSAARQRPPIAARLVGLSGKVAGDVIDLAHETTFGRTRGNDVVLQSSSVSKRHARVLFTNNAFVVVDLGSSNGTMVNGDRIMNHTLVDGDRIGVGEAEYRFELPPRP